MTSPLSAGLRGALAALPTRLAGRPWLMWLALAAFAVVLLAPGRDDIPATDRDESRYAQASRQIAETGDWIDIRFQDELRLKKPPGIYWLQAGLRQFLALPDTIASYRLPSLLAGVLSVLLLLAVSRRLLAGPAAVLPPVLLACSFLLGVEARLATTDAVLLLATLAAAGVLTLRWVGRPWPADDLLLALALAAGILVKGPVAPALVAGMFAADLVLQRGRRLRGLFTWRAGLLLLVLVLPWFWLIAARHGAAFWQESLLQDVAGKAVAVQESHGQPPGFYLLTLPLAAWPWAALLPAMLWFAWRERAQPLVQALVAWILPLWCLFELAPTKLVHYVLPTYPAWVLLGALALAQRSEWPRWVSRACLLLLLLGALLLAAGIAALGSRFGAGAAGIVLFVALLLAATVAVLWSALPRWVAPLALAAAYAQLWTQVVPAMDELWVSRRLAALAAPWREACDAPAVAQGFTEPSLVFELGTRTRLGEPAALPPGTRCRLRIADESNAPPTAEAIGEVRGFNYARGRPVRLELRVEPAR